ncbi:D-2-hydroxyacid dehydrogenase [Coprobacter secundus]|jgi:glycerate dehydrogenase|uniref:Glycerate dehydrogenase n=1 Tax=Coprobacter secundus subsp. similis TaxID=2751153 RepID=A0A7G1HSV0_9BACT|nr:D-2-hydroxyacid dehydrogenase [Coprobacter secundus]BCI62083.1 glycerate dehydrogenase [Coprobacter secundus subsp. similis]CCY38758.1 glycerate dehydrogenase [Tannerella sp. CAG:118]
MKIVVLDGYSLNPGDLSWKGLEELGECMVYERTPKELIIERVKDADAILTNKVGIKREIMESLPHLKYIGVLATGYNIIDIGAAKDMGITVTNIPAYSTDSVVQMVFAHLLNISNRIAHYTNEVKNGKWTNCPDFTFWDTPLFELSGKTMGIVGLGHIGMAVANAALAFGMKVIAFTSKEQSQLPENIVPVSKAELFKRSDVLSLHSPLTPETRNFVNKEVLDMMKPTAILINTSRGPLVNETDLAQALNSKKIFAAGVDVLSSEPPKADNPLLTARNCFITPHIAWATFEARKRLMDIAVDNLKSFMNGGAKNSVINL